MNPIIVTDNVSKSKIWIEISKCRNANARESSIGVGGIQKLTDRFRKFWKTTNFSREALLLYGLFAREPSRRFAARRVTVHRRLDKLGEV